MTRKQRVRLRPHDDFTRECLMTWDEYVKGVQCNAFIDYDGWGELATEHEVSDVSILPSTTPKSGKAPYPWVTHVVWYNK